MSVTFDPTTYTTNEGDILNVTLKASIPSISPCSVIVVNEDGTAKGSVSCTSLAEMTHVTYVPSDVT